MIEMRRSGSVKRAMNGFCRKRITVKDFFSKPEIKILGWHNKK
jgi:hypothetical protein